MRSSLSLFLTLAVCLAVMFCTVEEIKAFSVSLHSKNQRKFSPKTSRVNSVKLQNLEKRLRSQATLKSNLPSFNRFLKKYEVKVRNNF